MTAPLSDDDTALVAEYVLGLLPPDVARQVAVRLAAEPALRAEYLRWTERMAGLLDEIPEVAPPARAKTALTARLFPGRERQVARRGRFWLGLLTGTALAGLALVVVTPVLRPLPPTYQASLGAEGAAVRLAVAYSERSGELSLTGIAGAAPQGRDFQLWLIPSGQPPVSLGLVPATATARLVVPEALRGALAGGVLAVSEEPAGGSPTGLPTGPVLATAFLVAPVTGS